MIETEAGKTISSVISTVRDNVASLANIWFRGQSTYHYDLLPSIFRQGADFEIIYNESDMYEEFKRRYPEQSINHKNLFEWLTLMQHYGLPTRLLDWTSNILVALYFCCVSDQHSDGSIYAFDTEYANTPYKYPNIGVAQIMDTTFQYSDLYRYKSIEIQATSRNMAEFYKKIIYEFDETINNNNLLNGFLISELKSDIILRTKFLDMFVYRSNKFDSFKIVDEFKHTTVRRVDGSLVTHKYTDIKPDFSKIVALKYPHLNPRIRQQHGLFTLHGGMMIDGEEVIPIGKIENDNLLTLKLLKIRIKSSYKSNILDELNYSGIREATLFPEMEYQSKDIKRMHSQRVPRPPAIEST